MIVRCVEGRVADRGIHRQNGNPRGGQAPRYLFVRSLIVAVLNVEVDLALHGIFGVGDGFCPIARIVIEHQVDRQAACTEHKARTNVFAREAEPFDPCTRVVGEVGESDREAALLSNGASWRCQSSRCSQMQKNATPGKRPRPRYDRRWAMWRH